MERGEVVNRLEVVSTSKPRAVRELVVVIGDDDALAREVCAQLDAAPWRVRRASSEAELARREPALIVVTAKDCTTARPVVQSLAASGRVAPVVVIAETVDEEGHRAVTGDGAVACADAASLRERPWSVVVQCLLEIDHLRRRLAETTEEAHARSKLSRRTQAVRDETMGVLRATASGVLLSLQTLRWSRGVVLSSSAAGVVDSLCASVRSMFDILDSVQNATPSHGYPKLADTGRERATPSGGIPRP